MDLDSSFAHPPKRHLWQVTKLTLLGLACLIAIVLINTYRFTATEMPASINARNKAPDNTALTQFTEAEADAMLHRLSIAIQFPTISIRDQADANFDAFEGFTHFLEQSYPRVFETLSVTRFNHHGLLLHWQGQDHARKPILFLAHSDVVPVPDNQKSLWTHPPFSGAIVDGFIHGRGALDDKASLLGLLEAVDTHLKQGTTPTRSIYLAFGHDEEVGGQNGAVAIARHLEAQGISFEFVLDEGSYITRGLVPNIRERVALIGPGEKGYLSLKLTAKGDAGHSSKPPKMTTAGRLATAVAKIQSTPFPVDLSYAAEFVRGLGKDAPFAQRLLMANTWLFEPLADWIIPPVPELRATMRTTVAPTMLAGSHVDNVLPNESSAVVNYRILPGDSIQQVIERTKKIIDDPQVDVEIYGQASEPSRISPISASGYQLIRQSIVDVLADEAVRIAPMIVIGATDARHYEHLTEQSYRFSGLTLTPETVSGFHGVNEKIAINSYLESVRIYHRILDLALQE